MKKRLAALAVPLALALLLSGCGLFGLNNAVETPPPPTVSETPQPVSTYPSVYETATPQPVADARVYPAELTESEMALLDLFGEDADGWSLYDFAVPSGTQYVAVTLWQLEDGAWQRRSSDSASMSVGEGTGRIAVRFDLETLSFEYACQMGSGTMRHDPTVLTEDAESVAWGVSSLAESTEAYTDAPVALMLISGTEGNSHTQYIPQIGFDEPELFGESHVYDFAFTLEFVSEGAGE